MAEKKAKTDLVAIEQKRKDTLASLKAVHEALGWMIGFYDEGISGDPEDTQELFESWACGNIEIVNSNIKHLFEGHNQLVDLLLKDELLSEEFTQDKLYYQKN